MASGPPSDMYPSYEEIVVETDPPSVASLLREGLLRFNSGDTDGAIEQWRQVLRIDADNKDAIDYLESAGAPTSASAPHLRSLTPPDAFDDPTPPVGTPPSALRRSSEHQVIAGTIEPVDLLPSIIIDNSSKKNYRLLLALVGLAVVVGLTTFLLARHGDNTQTNAQTPPPAVASGSVAATQAPSAAAGDNTDATTFVVSLTATPADAAIHLDGELVGHGSVEVELAKDGSSHTLRVESDGFKSEEMVFVDVAPPAELALTRAETPIAARPRRPAQKRQRRAAKKETRPPVLVAPPPEAEPEPPTPASVVDEKKPDSQDADEPRRKLPPTDNKDPWAK